MDDPEIVDEWLVRRWVWTLVNDIFQYPRLQEILAEMRGGYLSIGLSKEQVVSLVTRMILNRTLLLYRAEPRFAAAIAALTLAEEAERAESAVAPRATTFIEIVLTDADDKPIAGQPFELELADGRTLRPKTNRNGSLRIESVPEGTCGFAVPELDDALWKRAM
jgi:hypothetical protein